MVLVLTFGVVPLVTVALSGLAARSVLSTALVFLVAGALVGPGFLGLIEVYPEGPLVSSLADLALFTVLFVDGGRLSLRELRAGWRLCGRALGPVAATRSRYDCADCSLNIAGIEDRLDLHRQQHRALIVVALTADPHQR